MLFYYLSCMIFFLISVFMFLLSLIYLFNSLHIFLCWNLMFLNSVSMDMFLYFDWMSLMFIHTVLLISSMIMFYCSEYMLMDLNSKRFFYLVLFFICSMLLMIISPNMVSIILGWDGLGLVSYCLVIFYQNYFSYSSGMLTVLMNRIGDVMIMISISFMFIFGSWNFMNLDKSYGKILMFIVILASFTKSAQFPFSSWLPAAMAAPTPVSSLVHSSTLVTAGVYLLIRFHSIIYKNEFLLNYIMVTGMITMFLAGVSANFEFDLKKIIAFSTLSQLGLMMVIYGMKFYILAFFHLIIHAMFKSMMFMCSGVLIHSLMGFQDIRYMGNLKEFMPLTFMFLMVSNFSLCGLPFYSGFFSKDMILEKIFMSKFYFFMYLVLIISTMLTVMYSFRLVYYLMSKNFNFLSIFNIVDSYQMNYSMVILMINSLFKGLVLNWLIFFSLEEIYLFYWEKVLILVICLMSLGLVMLFNKLNLNNFFSFFWGKMWMLYYLNMILNFFFISKMNYYYYLFDKGFVKYLFEEFLMGFLKILKFNNLNMNYLIYLIIFFSYLILLMFFL